MTFAEEIENEIKELDESTGNELFISVDSTAEKIKDIK